MNEFKKGELISFSNQFLILGVTVVLLLVAYFILKKMRPFILRHLDNVTHHRINLVESRYFPRVGQASILLIDQREFLVLQTKSGVCVSALEKVITNESEQSNNSSE